VKKNNQFVNGETTIIGAGTVVEGLLKATASTRIDGTVNGDISSEGIIVVAGEGVVNGNIKAVDVKISGTVKGNITTSGKIELVSSGKLIGDICTGSLSIDETAVFQGNCKMSSEDDNAQALVETEAVVETETSEKLVSTYSTEE